MTDQPLDRETLERELASVGRLTGVDDLPPRLRVAMEGSAEFRRRVEERIACDRLLDLVDEVTPPVGSVTRTVSEAIAVDAGVSRRVTWSVWRAPVALAAALLVVVAIGMLARSGPATAEPSADLLAQLDLLLDWKLLEEHADDLDLLHAADLVEAAHELDLIGDESAEDGR